MGHGLTVKCIAGNSHHGCGPRTQPHALPGGSLWHMQRAVTGHRPMTGSDERWNSANCPTKGISSGLSSCSPWVDRARRGITPAWPRACRHSTSQAPSAWLATSLLPPMIGRAQWLATARLLPRRESHFRARTTKWLRPGCWHSRAKALGLDNVDSFAGPDGRILGVVASPARAPSAATDRPQQVTSPTLATVPSQEVHRLWLTHARSLAKADRYASAWTKQPRPWIPASRVNDSTVSWGRVSG